MGLMSERHIERMNNRKHDITIYDIKEFIKDDLNMSYLTTVCKYWKKPVPKISLRHNIKEGLFEIVIDGKKQPALQSETKVEMYGKLQAWFSLWKMWTEFEEELRELYNE